MTDAWLVEPRPVPVELTDDYTHETYPPKPVVFPTIADRISNADRETLRLWTAGGIGEPA